MRALLVFVEGQADAAYVVRSLGQVASATFDERKAEDLPTPFGRSKGQGSQNPQSLVLNWNQRSPLSPRTVASSAEDIEPVFQAVTLLQPDPREPNRPDMVLVVRMGGDQHAEEVSVLLSRLEQTFAPQLTWDVSRIACAFIFDGDTPAHYGVPSGDCVQLREQRFLSDYAAVLKGAAVPHGTWSKDSVPLGLFVLHEAATRSGTLENVVEPAAKGDPLWQTRLQAAEQFLAAHEEAADAVYDRTKSDRAKARLTIAGQFRGAGSSLAQIMRRGNPKQRPNMPDSAFSSPEARALVSFLVSVPW